MSRTTSPDTGSGWKARIEMRRSTASMTFMGVSGLTGSARAAHASYRAVARARQGTLAKPKAARQSAAACSAALAPWAVLAVLIFGAGRCRSCVVAVYRFVPPPITWLMVERLFQGHGFDRRWVPLSRISPPLVRAVIAAEDAGFCEHHGFDFDAIQKAHGTTTSGVRAASAAARPSASRPPRTSSCGRTATGCARGWRPGSPS